MALFKILSNMDTGSQQLPTTYHQGYCYFDVNTGKFWIDVNDVPGSEKRMALNAYKSDWSSYAQTAESANTATSAALATRALSADSAVTDDNDQTITSTYGKEITLVNGNTLKLVNSNGNAIGNGTLSIPFIIGNSVTAGVWTGVYDNISSYSDGLMILYKPNQMGAATTTLNINNIGEKTVYRNGIDKLTTQYPVNQPILLVYSATQNDGCWICINDYATDNNVIPSAYCDTTTDVAAKTAICSDFVARPNEYVHLLVARTNTSANRLSLNINNTGSYPIFLNGEITSDVNYGLLAGTYIAFFDGSAYHLRTDSQLPADISGNAATATRANIAEYDITNQPIATSFIRNVSNSSSAGAIDVTRTVYDNEHEIYRNETSTISVASNYVLPTASADQLGGIKVGNGLEIDENGVLSVSFPTYDGFYS